MEEKKTACMRVSADYIGEKKINQVMEWNQISCPNQSSCLNEKARGPFNMHQSSWLDSLPGLMVMLACLFALYNMDQFKQVI